MKNKQKNLVAHIAIPHPHADPKTISPQDYHIQEFILGKATKEANLRPIWFMFLWLGPRNFLLKRIAKIIYVYTTMCVCILIFLRLNEYVVHIYVI